MLETYFRHRSVNQNLKIMYNFQNLPPGWRFQETPGHGYLHLPFADNQKIPSPLRMSSYEEDCAFYIPFMFHPDLIDAETQAKAVLKVKDWFPGEYEKAFGVTLLPGESGLKDKYFFEPLQNVGKRICGAAWGDWYEGCPKGFVYVCAGIVSADQNYKVGENTTDPQYFIIPENEFKPGMYFEDGKYQQFKIERGAA